MSMLRIGGIASGLDTEQIVRDLMRVEHMKTDKLFQERQVLEWQKDQYRDITNVVRQFRDDYFNVLKPETNLMSQTAMQRMIATSDNSKVAVTATAGALSGTSTFKVVHSALAARSESSGVTQGSAEGNRLELSDTMATVNEKLGGDSLDFDAEGKLTLTINDAEIEINETDTLNTVIRRINASGAGVQVHYSNFSDTFSITASTTGEGGISTDDGGGFFSAFGIEVNADDNLIGVPGNEERGRDAIFEINGFQGTRASNNFAIEGITYNILERVDEATAVMNISTQVDTEGIYDTIEKFVEDYNSLLDTINGQLLEERFRDFQPLTDAQKETMSDRDIELWEEKAQSGLLRGDSSLENMLRSMRTTLYEMVGDSNITDIGIETSRNYQDRGKLVLANGGQTLKSAIASNPEKVSDLFTRRSQINYSPSLSFEDRSQRSSESGLAHRLSDILNDNIRTTRDNSGRKGILLEKAGIVGDISEFSNQIDRQILDMNQRMDRLNELLFQRENQYYRQFAAMEKALQQLHAQGDWLMMQLNQGAF